MTKLGTTTTRLIMPSSTETDPAWIEVKTELYPLDVIDLKDGTDEYTLFCLLSERSIAGWNYTDLDGNPVPPTTAWLDKLPNEDKKVLGTYINELFTKSFDVVTAEQKKTSSVPLTETPANPSPPII